jgi:hypothetical protein
MSQIIENIGCPDLATGGRVGFGEGSRCFNKGLDNIKNKNIKTKGQADNMLKLAKTGARSSALRGMLGVWGLGGEAIIEAGIGAYKVLGQGVPAEIAWAESYWSYLDPRKWRGELKTRRDLLRKKSPRISSYIDALEKLEEKEKLERNLAAEENRMAGQQIGSPEGWNKKRIDEAKSKLHKFNERVNLEGGEAGLLKTLEKNQAEYENAEAEQMGKFTRFSPHEPSAKGKQEQAMKELMASKGVKTMPYTKDGKPVYKKDPKAEPWIDFIPAFRTATDIAKASLSDTDLEEILKAYGVPQLIGNKEKYNDYKKAVIRLQREQNPEFSADIIRTGFRHDPGMLGTQERFAHGGLTRTVAPDSGPVSRGLRSLYIEDMD